MDVSVSESVLTEFVDFYQKSKCWDSNLSSIQYINWIEKVIDVCIFLLSTDCRDQVK